MLARASASEIGPRDQDRCALEARLVEYVPFVGLIAPIEKKPFAQPATHHGFQELLGNHLIGVDVGSIHRSDEAGEILERLHHALTFWGKTVGSGHACAI